VNTELRERTSKVKGSGQEAGSHASGLVTLLRRALKGLSSLTGERLFEAIQIEVTSRCNLRCVMCPVTALADRWDGRDLSWEAFLRIGGAFRNTKYVHLQGWGEPLLHPRLFDMIRVAKDAGCRVGFTTNGTLLDSMASQRLLDLDIDLLAVSIAGVTRETHGAIRVGSDLLRILENLRGLLALRNKRQGPRPKVEIFFLMTKKNMAELPAVADLAASLGVDELVATNLDYVPASDQDALKAFADLSFGDACVRFVEDARARAKAAGLAFRAYPLEREEVALCEANPLKILFVSSDGWVSPCTYMGLTGQTTIPRIFDGHAIEVPRLRFGNIMERELLEIWESPTYRAFREKFISRRLAGMLLAGTAVAGSGQNTPKTLPQAPEPCRTCPKLFGV